MNNCVIFGNSQTLNMGCCVPLNIEILVMNYKHFVNEVFNVYA